MYHPWCHHIQRPESNNVAAEMMRMEAVTRGDRQTDLKVLCWELKTVEEGEARNDFFPVYLLTQSN